MTCRALKEWQRALANGAIKFQAKIGGQVEALTAQLDKAGRPKFIDSKSHKFYGSPSAHRGAVFKFKTVNTYDTYKDANDYSMREILGLPLGAPK